MGKWFFNTTVVIINNFEVWNRACTNNVPEDNNNSTIYGIAYMESWYHAKS